jgi:hypothetical protein
MKRAHVLLALLLIVDFAWCMRPYWVAGGPSNPLAGFGWANPAEALDHYQHSQFVVGWNSKTMRLMNDQQLYALAGWLYIHGSDPTAANAEHPPLAKYIIGVGEKALYSAVAASMAAGLVAILMIFFFAARALGNPFSAFVAAVLFLNTQLFINYAAQPYLEVFVLAVLAAGVWLLARMWSGEGNALVQLVALSALIGLGTAMKWSVIVLAAISLIFLASIRRFDLLRRLIALAPLAAGLYVANYVMFFAHGRSLPDFIAFESSMIQRWIAVSAAAQQPPFTIWRILFTGYCSYGDYVTINWRWYWPVCGAALVGGLVYWLRKRTPLLGLAFLWFFGYMLFFSTGPAWDRYILPAFPASMIITVSVGQNLYAAAARAVTSRRVRSA